MENFPVQKTLIGVGLFLVALGLFWPWLSRVPVGRLPGDIVIDRPGFKFYFPITTMVIISVVLTLVLKIFRK